MAVSPAVEKHRRVDILDIPVDVVGFEEAVELISSFLTQSEPKVVVTADASGINIAQSDAEYRSIVQAADLVTADSVGVLWAMKRSGSGIEGRVSGVDLVDGLCKISAETGHRIFLLGSEPGIAEAAAERLRLKHPGCNIVGTRHGYFPSSDDDVVAAEIASLKPDVLFVAMGIPRQEKFIAKTKSVIGAKVAMGVGGSLDVFSGRVRRAPKLFQKLNLEWLWRTVSNPKKLSKAKHLPLFVWRVLFSNK